MQHANCERFREREDTCRDGETDIQTETELERHRERERERDKERERETKRDNTPCLRC